MVKQRRWQLMTGIQIKLPGPRHLCHGPSPSQVEARAEMGEGVPVESLINSPQAEETFSFCLLLDYCEGTQ